MRSPIIFLGMHRSGTSLIGKVLEQAGLFLGVKKDENNEAIFFQRLNDWLLQQSGATWDRPNGIADLLAATAALSWTEEYLKAFCSSPRAIEFLGVRRFLSGFEGLREPWGWKDPRNTYTLPLWARIFPGAKLIYIERHGVDVAQSLRARALRGFQSSIDKYKIYRSIAFLRPKLGGFVDSPRCLSLEGGFALWTEYTDQARLILNNWPDSRVLRLRYEEFLKEPVETIRASAAFCELKASQTELRRLVSMIKTERALSYLRDPELRKFATDNREQLLRRGYAI